MRRVLIVAALAALPIACSDGSEEPMGDLATRVGEFLDISGLEDEVRTQIEAQTDSRPASVDCPTDVPIEAGGSFECTAELKSGAQYTIRVTQTDDQGNVEWEVTDQE
jgi:hypothetical protein